MKDVSEYNPLDPDTIENPYPFHRAMREQAPVHQLPFGPYVVATYDLVLRVILDPDAFSSKIAAMQPRPSDEVVEIMRGGYPPVDTLLTADPPEHFRYRTLVTRAFSGRRVAGMEDYIRGRVEELIDDFADDGRVELVRELAIPLPLSVIADQLGVPRSDMDLFKRWSDSFVAGLGSIRTNEEQVKAARDVLEFQHYFAERIEERRTEPRDDILSDLIAARLDGHKPLDVPEMLSILQQFLVAGNETTTNLLGSATLLLCRHPEAQRAVREDPSLIPNMVEEAMRLESPVQGLFRVATRDIELGEVKIPQGSPLIVMYAAANRDGAKFPHPDRFDVQRANAREHLAFGRGEHFCVGAALARKEAQIAFERLLARTRDIRLAPGAPEPRHMPSFILRGLAELPLEIETA